MAEYWPRPIPCASPQHGARAQLRDDLEHTDSLGTYTGVLPPPMHCERCAHYEAANAAEAKARVDAEQAAAWERLRQTTGLSAEQLVDAMLARVG